MKIIKVFCSFGSSSNCIDVYKRLYHLLDDPEFNVSYKFTEDDDYTHAFILNTAMPKFSQGFPKENVIGMAFEPIEFLNLSIEFIKYAIQNIGKYFIGNTLIPISDNKYFKLPNPFIEHYGYMWHIMVPRELFIKNKLMSIMVSEKHILHGHKYRHLLVRHILESNLPIDIYGNGCELYKQFNDNRIKGKFNELEPYKDYYFHIAIENTQTPHYFSEKITNSLLSQTNTIYLGCININKYFPFLENNGIYNLSGVLENDIKLLEKICNNPQDYFKKIEIDDITNIISIKNIINQI